MDLVIKPTEKCNFKCTFCSSTSIADDINDIVEIKDVISFLKRYPETRTIIVNGGDPLMMPPEYYHEIMDYADEHCPDLILSFTSNLWAFYKKPSRWVDLLRRRNVSIITSFQYGGGRLKGDFTEFSEQDLWNVSDLCLELLGSRPDFISVIGYDNAADAIKNVELAKEMGVDCKLNYAMSSGEVKEVKKGTMGNEGNQFILSDMYEIYVDIWKRGLAEWEYNTRQMAVKIRGELTTCPLARTCDMGIRTMQPSGRYYSCPALADDDVHRIDFDKEMNGERFLPLQNDPELASMKVSCFGCPMFAICNGCRKTIRDHKRLGLVEQHCRKMKTLAEDIIEINGLSGQLEPTPYFDESGMIARG